MTSQMLSLKYRPQTFRDVVGQRVISAVLRQMILKNQLPSGLLFSGTRGGGKTSTARILAAALNCDATPELRPCTTCHSCLTIKQGNSLSVLELDAASNGSVSEVRTLLDSLRYTMGAKHRVVIFDEAHQMSREAFDALLKTLEEPPPNTTFLLLTTEPTKIRETVASRLMPFNFLPISQNDITARLEHITSQENTQIPQDVLQAIAIRARGGLRDAVMGLDQVIRSNITTIEEYEQLTGSEPYIQDIVRAMLSGDHSKAQALIEIRYFSKGDASQIVSDLILTFTHMLQPTQDTQELASLTTKSKVFSAIKILWDLKTRITGTPWDMTVLATALITGSFEETSSLNISTQTRSLTASTEPQKAQPLPRLTLQQMQASLAL